MAFQAAWFANLAQRMQWPPGRRANRRHDARFASSSVTALRIPPVAQRVDDLDAGGAAGGRERGAEDFVRFARGISRQGQAGDAGGFVAL